MTRQLDGCRLDAPDLAAILANYAEAAGRYRATVDIGDHRARVQLRGDKQSLAAFLDEMIAQEGTCCSFLHFDTGETADGYRVEISVRGLAGPVRPVLEQAVDALFPGSVNAR